MRLDKFISDSHPELSRHFIKNLILEGRVKVNGCLVDPDFQTSAADKIDLSLPSDSVQKLIPQDLPLVIVHEDENFLVVDKPSGLVVHPSPGHEQGTLVNALEFHFQEEDLSEHLNRSGIVHRLDKDTSGLLLIAKNETTQNSLQDLFREHLITKEYLALIKGTLDEPAGEIKGSIMRDPKNRLRFTVGPAGKEAVTRFFIERKLPGYSLLRLIPLTGRTHQLRVHLSHLKHPIVGDRLYGGEKSSRLFLHATRLAFKLNNREWEFNSPLPKELKEILSKL